MRHNCHEIFCILNSGNLQHPLALREFQIEFCAEFGKYLKTWNGARNIFDGGVDIAEKVFGHLAPSTNLDE